MGAVNRTLPATPRVATVNGWPAYVWPDGRVRPIVCGGEGPEGSGQPGAGAAGEGTPPPPPPGQPPAQPPAPPAEPPAADLDGLQRALDAAAASGQDAALRPLMDAVGVSDAAGLQEFVTAAVAQRDANLTEVERREQAAAERERVANERIATANAQARAAMVRAALVSAGMDGEKVAGRVGWVTVPDGADQAAVDQAVATFREANPELFTTTNPGAPGSVPGRPGQPTPPDELEQARERGRKHREQRTTNSDPFATFPKIG